MGFGFDFLIVILLFFGHGTPAGNDFLSLIPTDSYWDAKHVTLSLEQLQNDAALPKPAQNMDILLKDLESPEFKTRSAAKRQLIATGAPAIPALIAVEKSSDPEVAAIALELVDELQLHSKEQDIRRLMAIRTLGERKERAASDQLKSFTTSKDLFVAEYAARALSQIEDKPYIPIDHKKEVAGDLRLIPKASAVVAQCTGLNRQPVSLNEVMDASSDSMAAFAPPNAPAAGPARKDILNWLTLDLLKIAEQVGDIRFDGITLSISEDAGEEGGSAVVILRGEYDEQAAFAALKRLSASNSGIKVRKERSIDLLEEEETSVIMPSNNLFIIIFSDKPSDRAAPRQSVLAALKAGDAAKSQIADNKEMSALMATVDTTAPIWAVAAITDEMRKESVLEAYKTLTFSSTITPESTQFTLMGQGLSDDKLKASIATVDGQIQSTIIQGKAAVAQMKSLQPAIDFLQSIKFASNGTTVTVTAEMKNTVVQSLLANFGPTLIGPLIEEHQTVRHP